MATLIINRSDSRCGACGKSASPYATEHDRVYGYSPGPGCGAKFDRLDSDYSGREQKEAVMEMRPDLPWFGIDW